MSASIYDPPNYRDDAEQSAAIPVAESMSEPPRRRGRRKLILFALVFAGLGAWWVRGGGTLSQDLPYLPDNSVLVVQCRIERLENSPLLEELKPLLESTVKQHVPGDSQSFLNEVAGCFDTVTVGIAAPPTPNRANDAKAAGVLRCRRDFVIQDVIPGPLKSRFKQEKVGEEHTVFTHSDAAFCQIDPRTIAFGNPQGLREVIERTFQPAALSEQMQEAMGQAGFSTVLTVVAAGPAESVDQIKQFIGVEPPESIVVTTDINSDLEISASVTMQNEKDIETIRARAEPALAIAKLQSAEAAKFVDALEFSASGTTLTISATVPGDSLVEIAKQRAPQLAGMRLPAPPMMPGARQASAQMCMYHTAAMNSAIERYYFDVGEWPTKIEQLIKYAPDSPHFCAVHQMYYAIDPDSHRVTEADSVAEPADPASLAADDRDPFDTIPPATDSPRGAFEYVAFAAKDGDVGRLLDGFTEAGRAEIAADLTDSAEEAVALHSHRLPGVAREFRQLQNEQSPALQEPTSGPPIRTELDYLLSIASFMEDHRIEFSSLAGIYEPCVLGDVLSEDKWAVGRVTYDKDGVVRETTLGFVRDTDNWRICILSEIPIETRERLLVGLEG